MEITEEMAERAANALDAHFQFCGHPGTRVPGTEAVNCEEAARIVLDAAFPAARWTQQEPLGRR